MNIKKAITAEIMAMLAMSTFAVPTVSNETAKQRYPWNGLVDITCEVSGISGTSNGLNFAVAAVMPGSGDVRKASQFWVVKNGAISTDREVCSNGTYRLVWDAQADLGAVVCSNMVIRVSVSTVAASEKVQLWEGGPYWAETNIGADEPWEYGYYFWWGDTVGYKRVNDAWVASDGSASNFSFSLGNAPTDGKDIATLQREGWITADRVLAPEHDAAQVKWGGGWRMPVKQEFDDLLSKCEWIWTATNGVNGWLVRGRGDYASSSIFLPCAGTGNGTSLSDADSRGFCWSAVPYWGNNRDSLCLRFYSSSRNTHTLYSCYGITIRPVQGAAK